MPPLTIYNFSVDLYSGGSLDLYQGYFSASVAGNLITSGAVLYLDAGAGASYPGSGTNWFSLTGSVTSSLINGPTFTLAGASSSINFDGTNDYLYFVPSSSLNGLGPLTINMWAKFNINAVLWYKGDFISRGWFVEYGNNIANSSYGTGQCNGLGFSLNADPNFNLRYFISSSHIPVNTWCNVAITWDGTFPNAGDAVKIYVDGVEKPAVFSEPGTLGDTHTPDTGADPLSFGQSNSTGTSATGYFSGSAGVLMLYNRALTAAEVLQNYNALSPKYTSNIVTTNLTHWFDAATYSGTGTTWTNLISANPNIALVNGPTYVSNGASSYFRLDGVNDYMSGSGYQLSSTTRATTINFIMSLTRSGSSETDRVWVAGGDPFQLELGQAVGGNVLYSDFTPGSTNFFADIVPNTGGTLMARGQTYMVTFTSDDTKVSLYLNGTFISSSTEFLDIGSSYTNSTFNLFWQGGGFVRSGSISHLLIYTSSLSQAEITQNYNVLKTRYGLT